MKNDVQGKEEGRNRIPLTANCAIDGSKHCPRKESQDFMQKIPVVRRFFVFLRYIDTKKLTDYGGNYMNTCAGEAKAPPKIRAIGEGSVWRGGVFKEFWALYATAPNRLSVDGTYIGGGASSLPGTGI